MTTTVRLEVDGALASVVLDDPEHGNVLTLDMAEQLRDRVAGIASLEGIRCVVLRAEGKRFCVGGDIASFADSQVGERINEVVALPLHDALNTLEGLEVPVVSVVQGAAGGGGVGLALGADLVIAAEEAFFVTGYGLIGLSPDCAVSWTLARALGVQRALELYLTNRKMSATEAFQAGLVSRVVPAADLSGSVAELTGAITASSPEAVAQTKRLMRTAWSRSRSEHMADEATTIGGLGDRPPAREGFAAFLEKRPPQF
ncbi:enoyl-CoA hydratase/isomerase family protein [Cumulibacter manganitolerans]|uniref:enoyl-CoA hydratase/isomerase family protein n=1 Tax=Cumulibacter manganitolerans TaxID=1884992 RepID=UPI001294DF0D|nr:enoyl-CoA hydratase-related protein [Cumulibacter manganitolerans]